MHTLAGVLARWERAPRAFGGDDCLHFALSGHAAAGNRDLRGALPAYDSAPAALRALARLGFSNLAEALDAHAARLPAARARPGDIAMNSQPTALPALGLVTGPLAVFLAPGRGFLRRPARLFPIWRAP